MKLKFFTILLVVASYTAYGQFNNGGSVTILDGATLYSEGDIQNTTGSTMTINGTAALKGDFTNQGNVTSDADGTVQFMGTTSSNMTPGAGNYSIISMDKAGASLGAADVTLLGSLLVDKTLDFTDGSNTRMVIGNNNLSIASAATVVAAAATKYVVTNGTGVMEQKLATSTAGYPGAITHPVGDINNYSPITSNLTGTTLGATMPALSVNVKAVKHPNLLTESTDYINRYWNVQATDVTTYKNVMTGTYVDGDIVGTEADMIGSYRDVTGGVWQFTSASSNATNNTVTATNNLLHVDFTGQNLKRFTDLQPKLVVLSAPPSGGAIPMLFKVDINELNGAASAGNTVIGVAKSSFLTFSYDASATNVGGVTVNNSAWTFSDSHPIYWLWTTSSSIPASGTSPTFAFIGSFNSNGASGSQEFRVLIPQNSGGDTNPNNNSDFDTITY